MKLQEWFDWKKIPKGEVANALGIHRSYISHILSGRPCPPELAERIETLTDGHVSRAELVWPEAKSETG
jgi:DNA-binding transcriptional regulator YdaS (Cro superfamily)